MDSQKVFQFSVKNEKGEIVQYTLEGTTDVHSLEAGMEEKRSRKTNRRRRYNV